MFDAANSREACDTFRHCGLNTIVKSQVRIHDHAEVFGWLYRGDVLSQQRQTKLMERLILFCLDLIIINYWTRSSKISWFVGGEQINYLPMPKAEANNWSASHRQITIFCENRVQWLFYHSLINLSVLISRKFSKASRHCLRGWGQYACSEYYLAKGRF